MAVGCAGVLAARSSLADHYTVPSGSMEPTVLTGDRVLVDKSAYGLRLPFSQVSVTDRRPAARGDVVVLDSPDEDIVLLKRVVAAGGDVVKIRQGRVWINDEPANYADEQSVSGLSLETLPGQRTEHLVDLSQGGGPPLGPVRVPDGEVLVMGDHRGNSRDGRSFGWVKEDAILGRVVASYWRNGQLTYESIR